MKQCEKCNANLDTDEVCDCQALVVEQIQNIDLEIKTDLKKEVLQKIEWNYAEIKNYVAGSVEKYKNLVVTEDSIKTAKDVKAKLNKLADELNERKKEVKRECNVAVTLFENEIKDVISLITTASENIGKQTKAFDELESKRKKEMIQKLYDEKIGDLKELFPLEKFWLDSWLLKGTKIKQIEDDLWYKINQINQDLEIINTTPLKYAQEVKNEYIRTMSISQALQKNNQLLENDKRFEEMAQRKLAEEKAVEQKPNLAPTIEPAKTFLEAVEMQDVTLIITVSKDKLNDLKDYLYLGGYDYEVKE
jgi:uncharacterized protein YqgV (UPF0045/DUF77 family)